MVFTKLHGSCLQHYAHLHLLQNPTEVKRENQGSAGRLPSREQQLLHMVVSAETLSDQDTHCPTVAY